MSNRPTNPSSRKQNSQPAPEIDPSPQSVPRKFPENPTPLDNEGETSTGSQSAHRLGSGEDPSVESGVSGNDPEQSPESDVEQSME
jgi:hypothetical protein